MDRSQAEEILLKHIEKTYMSRLPEGPELSPDTHLFREGIIDSVGVLMLVQFLEDRFELSVEPDEMVIDHFASISDMARLIEKKTS